eukprot:4220185-Amphidinium_carterae.1
MSGDVRARTYEGCLQSRWRALNHYGYSQWIHCSTQADGGKRLRELMGLSPLCSVTGAKGMEQRTEKETEGLVVALANSIEFLQDIRDGKRGVSLHTQRRSCLCFELLAVVSCLLGWQMGKSRGSRAQEGSREVTAEFKYLRRTVAD